MKSWWPPEYSRCSCNRSAQRRRGHALHTARVQRRYEPTQWAIAHRDGPTRAASSMLCRLHESQIGVRAEIGEIREYRVQVAGIRHAQPLGERRGVLFDTDPGNQLATREARCGIQALIRETLDRSAAIRV